MVFITTVAQTKPATAPKTVRMIVTLSEVLFILAMMYLGGTSCQGKSGGLSARMRELWERKCNKKGPHVSKPHAKRTQTSALLNAP